MDPAQTELSLVKDALDRLKKEDLVRLLLTKIEDKHRESIPLSVFTCGLSPLAAIVRYLRDQKMRTKEIAALLHRAPPSISEAYRASKGVAVSFPASQYYIPHSLFAKLSKLSILEVVVWYLHTEQQLKFSAIARLLGRDPKTIWTLHHRAKTKLVVGKGPRNKKRGEHP